MRLDGQRESDEIEDRRDDDDGGGGGGGGGGGAGFAFGGAHLGVGTVVLALLGGWLLGVNPLTLLGLLGGGGGHAAAPAPARPAAHAGPHVPRSAEDEARKHFVAKILASTEDVWTAEFQASGGTYRKPVLVLFRGATPTACGQGQAAMGPFYCPGDQKVYIDLGFYDTLRDRLGAPGDFAQAYVIAHEVGHHVQNLMGISAKVDRKRRQLDKAGSNALSVRLELQADCLAGVWGHHAQAERQLLEQGDLEEAINAATQIGDDTLQRHAQGTVVPESFTHGSSAQRVAWFRKGFETGQVAACNTFER